MLIDNVVNEQTYRSFFINVLLKSLKRRADQFHKLKTTIKLNVV